MSLLTITSLIAAGLLAAAPAADDFPTSAGAVKITPIHHASLMIQVGQDVIHVDPWTQGNYSGLPKATLILITDIHPDHLDPKLIAQLRTSDTQIVAPPAAQQRLPSAKYLANGESMTWHEWKIEAVPMYNLTRGPAPGRLYHDKGRGNGYILTYGGKRFYIAGDTEATPEMKALRNIDVAFVPMNLPFTMAPEEAAEAVKAFKPKVVYPYHYRGSDPKKFEAALQGTGIEVRLRDWY